MEKFIVKGEVQLKGELAVNGAKNAALPIMASTLLSAGVSVIHGVPCLRDIEAMQEILTLLGAKIQREANTLIIDTSAVTYQMIPEPLMREMRASIFLMGPLLGRFGKLCLSYPGGCDIGHRPIDLHIKALEKLGAVVTERFGCIAVEANRLGGADIYFDFPSVGATENAMMAAVVVPGTTTLHNAAREPEIEDLQCFLNKMGANIQGAGTDRICIEGVTKLSAAEYTIMPDRIQAGTYLLAGAMSRGDVTVTGIAPECLFSVIAKLKESGASVTCRRQSIRVMAEKLWCVDVKTLPHPGFPTDLQAPVTALLATAQGTSIVTETVFENRFKHVDELVRMGAKIKVEGRSAVIHGVRTLTATNVSVPDLRAGGALVMAALVAEGVSEIDQIHHIDRGYERLEEKLALLGAAIKRVHC